MYKSLSKRFGRFYLSAEFYSNVLECGVGLSWNKYSISLGAGFGPFNVEVQYVR
jgi:hypothetical protein